MQQQSTETSYLFVGVKRQPSDELLDFKVAHKAFQDADPKLYLNATAAGQDAVMIYRSEPVRSVSAFEAFEGSHHCPAGEPVVLPITTAKHASKVTVDLVDSLGIRLADSVIVHVASPDSRKRNSVPAGDRTGLDTPSADSSGSTSDGLSESQTEEDPTPAPKRRKSSNGTAVSAGVPLSDITTVGRPDKRKGRAGTRVETRLLPLITDAASVRSNPNHHHHHHHHHHHQHHQQQPQALASVPESPPVTAQGDTPQHVSPLPQSPQQVSLSPHVAIQRMPRAALESVLLRLPECVLQNILHDPQAQPDPQPLIPFTDHVMDEALLAELPPLEPPQSVFQPEALEALFQPLEDVVLPTDEALGMSPVFF